MCKHFSIFRKFGIILSLSLFSFEVSSAVITSKIDKSSLTVGDRLTFQVATIVPKGAIVTPPTFENNTINNIIIKGWNSHKSEHDNADSIVFSYIITTYVPEQCTIPSLPYIIQDKGKSDTLHSQALPLQVQSVIAADTVDIKGLKAQQLSGHAPLWWIWIIAIALVIFIGYIVYKKFFSKKSSVIPTVPLLPPYEEAIAALHELERQKYLQRGLIREYVFDISEILKRYIERRFTINASEFTTEEMIAWLGISGLESKFKQSVEWFFRTSDPVKFAKYIPDDSIINKFSLTVNDFLNATRPVLEDSSTSKTNNHNTGTIVLGSAEQAMATQSTGEKR